MRLLPSLSMAFPGHSWAADATADTGLTEIVVTAQKYNSTVQNTPISMSAISGDQLIAAGMITYEEPLYQVLALGDAEPVGAPDRDRKGKRP